jgi:predicted nucleotidyltransferase
MANFEDIKKEISERIKKVENFYKIILFGSHASGKDHPSSDIDLLVVLDSFETPKDFRERSENYLKVSRALRELERKFPIDLIVYTRPEFDKFIEIGSMFSKTILKEGQEIP